MGYRLHYATTYKVEYSGGFGNHLTKDLNNLIADICTGAFFDSDEIAYSTEIEIYNEELKEGIKKLKKYNDTQFKSMYTDLYNGGYNIEDVVKFLQDALDNADKDNDYVKFYWF
jgi:hypothetical protein